MPADPMTPAEREALRIGGPAVVRGIVTGLEFGHDRTLLRVRVASDANIFGGWFDAAEVIAGPGFRIIPWPPTGDMVQAAADDIAPYAESPTEYAKTCEVVLDVLDAAVTRAAGAEGERDGE